MKVTGLTSTDHLVNLSEADAAKTLLEVEVLMATAASHSSKDMLSLLATKQPWSTRYLYEGEIISTVRVVVGTSVAYSITELHILHQEVEEQGECLGIQPDAAVGGICNESTPYQGLGCEPLTPAFTEVPRIPHPIYPILRGHCRVKEWVYRVSGEEQECAGMLGSGSGNRNRNGGRGRGCFLLRGSFGGRLQHSGFALSPLRGGWWSGDERGRWWWRGRRGGGGGRGGGLYGGRRKKGKGVQDSGAGEPLETFEVHSVSRVQVVQPQSKSQFGAGMPLEIGPKQAQRSTSTSHDQPLSALLKEPVPQLCSNVRGILGVQVGDEEGS